MDIRDLIAACEAKGISLSAHEDELRVHFDGEPPEASFLALLRTHKKALMSRLGRLQGIPISPRPASMQRKFPASLAQRRLWYVDSVDRAGAAYNMVGAYRISGAFDVDALQESLDAVLSAHETLRTTLHDMDGEIYQCVGHGGTVPLSRIDLSACEPEAAATRLEAAIRGENERRMSLANGPLIHAVVVRMSKDEFVLLLNVHHVACDGWSVGLLERAIGAAYRAVAKGCLPELTAGGPQYGDYVAWSRERESDASWRDHLPFWQAMLEGIPSLHGIPLDRPRPAVQSFSGRTVRCRLPASWLTSALALCQSHGSSLFMLLHAALASVVGVYSRESDVVIGFPVAGRLHPGLASTVGLFVNTLVLRTRLDSSTSFLENLDQSRTAVIGALEHQDVPFDALVDAVRPLRSRSYAPLTQVVLALSQDEGDALDLGGVAVARLNNDDAPVKFDIQVEATQRADGLDVAWRFSTALFDDASAQAMLVALSTLLERAVADPSQRTLAMLSAEIPPVPPFRSRVDFVRIEERMMEFAGSAPTRVAVVAGNHALTYAELDRQSDAVARRLRSGGIRRGDPVALCTMRTVETIVGMFGAMKAGAAYVPLDPAYPAARLALILDDCKARIVLTHEALREKLAPFGRHLLMLDDIDDATGSAALQDDGPVGDATDAAYIIYTSGTTGSPKGVVVAHAGVINLVEHFDAIAPSVEPWSGALWGSISFDLTVYEIFTVLCRGGTLHIVPDDLRLAPRELFGWMDKRSVAAAFLHAGYLEPFIDYLETPGNGASLRRMMVGVEPIACDLLRAIASRLPELNIVNAYGPTEITVCCTTYLVRNSDLPEHGRVPIGHAVNGATLIVMGQGGDPVPTGAIGELYVGGIGVALGYLNNAAMTDARFVSVPLREGPMRMYRTGDLVRWRPDGALEFIGRADEQVKIRGFRVEPVEIELQLAAVAALSDVAVVVQGEGASCRLVAYVVPHPGEECDASVFAAAIKRDLGNTLPEYMVPDDIVVIERLPLTTNGKLDRAALPRPQVLMDGAHHVAPNTDVQRRIARLWESVLDLKTIGIHDDFFTIGGQSLLATRLIGAVRREFDLDDIDLPFASLFENSSIARFAEVVERGIEEQSMRKTAMRLDSLQADVEEGIF